MYRAWVMICQHLFWPGIRKTVWKEVNNGDTCQSTKRSKIKYGKLPAKESDEISRNKIHVDIIGPFVRIIKVKKAILNLKYITTKEPVTRWLKITKNYNKIAIAITNLVETKWLDRYPRPEEITFIKYRK